MSTWRSPRINDSYYCGRLRPNAIISVLTGNSYVVAEYDDRTGNIRWQRVVNASQKEGIHHWLREHFPMKVEQPVARTRKTPHLKRTPPQRDGPAKYRANFRYLSDPGGDWSRIAARTNALES